MPSVSKDTSESSSSSSSSSKSTATSKSSSKHEVQSPRSSERKSPSVANDYDEDFSETSHSPATPTKEPISKTKLDNIDIESIQEDIEDKPSAHDTSRSSTSKSSGDEQSEILVLVKKSANNTPRAPDDKLHDEEEYFPSAPPTPVPQPQPLPQSQPQPKIEAHYNDDTSHDISDDDDANERIEQENKVDKITDSFLRTFIDEAIGHGKHIERLKIETAQKTNSLTQEAKEWMSDEDTTDDENSKQTVDEPPNVFKCFSFYNRKRFKYKTFILEWLST